MYGCFRLKRVLCFSICIILIFASFCFVRLAIPYGVKIKAATPTEGVFVPIIMYHSILNDKSKLGEYVVSAETLESDMKYLTENGYTAVFIADLVSYVYDDIPLPEKPVILTFDDGNYNNMTYALPLLKKYDMKAVISIVGSFTEESTAEDSHNPLYSYLSWNDTSELIKSGYIEIGNHTYDMHGTKNRRGCTIKWGESLAAYSKVLGADVLKLQKLITENTGYTPITFTYPYGFICNECIPLLKEMGFKAALSCYEKPNYITKDADTLFELNRYNRPNGISTEKFMKKALAK